MKYLFGPVPSRRLGISLGIAPFPLKICNWNCVYCQLGRTKPVTNERRIYCPPEEIVQEIAQVLENHQENDIDWITIVGSGEPTLHSEIGLIIREIKKLTDIPVAVITNGSLLFLPEVRASLNFADAVLPSLDAGSADLYRRLNRPHPGIKYHQYIEGLRKFRESFNGKFWVEVMLVKDLNDSESELQAIHQVLQEINPDEIHINIPTRPPVEAWVQPPDEKCLQRAGLLFGEGVKVLYPVHGNNGLGDTNPEAEDILNIISRHPLSEDELSLFFGHTEPKRLRQLLETLEMKGFIQEVERNKKRFWVAGGAHFPV